jgi:hypothetical protein
LNGFTFVGGVRFPDCGVNTGLGVTLKVNGDSGELGVTGVEANGIGVKLMGEYGVLGVEGVTGAVGVIVSRGMVVSKGVVTSRPK